MTPTDSAAAKADDGEYQRMLRAIEVGNGVGQSPAMSVARMNPKLENAGVLLRRWLDEQREAS
jgi:hypothetical protein